MTEYHMPVDWLYLPKIPFDIIMTKIAHESLTTLRSCTEVCSTWNGMIEKGIWKNLEVMSIIRDKVEVAFGQIIGPSHLRTCLLPTSEEISNAKWLSK